MDYNGCKIAVLRLLYLFFFRLFCVGNLCIGTQEIDAFVLVSDSNYIVVDHCMHELKSRGVHIEGKASAYAPINLGPQAQYFFV